MMVTHPLVANPPCQYLQTSHTSHAQHNADHEKLSNQVRNFEITGKTSLKQSQDTHKRTHIVEGLIWHAQDGGVAAIVADQLGDVAAVVGASSLRWVMVVCVLAVSQAVNVSVPKRLAVHSNGLVRAQKVINRPRISYDAT
jgi:hypothetical protein